MHNVLLAYIKDANPELHDIINAHIVLAREFDKQEYCGITFLMPNAQNIAALASKSDPEVVDFIRAHIVYDVLRTPQEWREAGEDILNANGKALDVSSNSYSNVTLKGGAVIKLEKQLGDDVVVWVVESGTVAESDRQPAGERARRQSIAPVKGGDEYRATAAIREQIAIYVANKFAIERPSGVLTPAFVKIGGDEGGLVGKPRDAFLEHAISLVYHIGCNEPQLLYNRVLPVFSFQRVDFYNLLEPFRHQGEYLIPDDVIVRWWTDIKRGKKLYIDSVIKTINSWFEQGKSHCNCMMYSDPRQVVLAIERCRVKITKARSHEEMRSMCNKMYSDFVNLNMIDACKNIVPKDLHDFYRKQPFLKRAQDEARYISVLMFDKLDKQFNVNDYSSILIMIMQILSESYGGAEPYTVLFSAKGGGDKGEELYMFACSTSMMYLPYPPSMPYPVKTVNHRPVGFGVAQIFNIQSASLEVKNKALLSSSGGDNVAVNNAINVLLSQGDLDSEVAAKLRSMLK